MKKTHKTYAVALLTALCFGATGCKDSFFDHPPQDALTLDSYYQTNEQVKASTNALYNSPWFNFNNKAFWAITELSGGNARTYSGDVINFANFSVTADNNELTNAWRSLFSVVAQSNALINNLPAKVPASVDPAVVNNALGEAHFMRAMAYFYLVRLWGNVPIIENTLDYVYSPKINTNRVEDVYTLILKDFQFAEANCTKKIRTGTSVDNGHVSSGSASAMLAKVYLYQQNYAQARTYAEKVINSGEFKLYGAQVAGKTFTDLFRTANNNNEESVVALQWVAGSAYGHGNSMQASFAISSQITGTGDGYGVIGPTIDLQSEFAKEPGDVRRKATIMLAGDFYSQLNSSGGGYTVPADVNAQNTKAGIKKYVVGNRADNGGLGAAQSTGINTYLMRYSEVLLIEAEAVLAGAASTNNPAALTPFNLVRSRAGLSPKASITQADILRERRLELAIEGDYWFDLGRLDGYKATSHPKATAIISQQERGTYSNDGTQIYSEHFTPGNDRFLFPYPSTETAINPLLREAPVPYTFK
ncbi:RagB/SusD family nutrient uptake outer membrane protein [Spirosoma spitsbergense]|uniref:RagB/SusD family nutrient uptake outer membrane protein n=1 Tax=Spirosoma spitsbergense TaxID=431554 RepID=UPI000373D3CC|nr:RagB/SusD family nutrient uptake outer membrane protein [Spirosoma spitsbergense]